MRYLIEVRPNVFRDDWFPKEDHGQAVVYEHFADADHHLRMFSAATTRIVETDETDAQIASRLR